MRRQWAAAESERSLQLGWPLCGGAAGISLQYHFQGLLLELARPSSRVATKRLVFCRCTAAVVANALALADPELASALELESASHTTHAAIRSRAAVDLQEHDTSDRRTQAAQHHPINPHCGERLPKAAGYSDCRVMKI